MRMHQPDNLVTIDCSGEFNECRRRTHLSHYGPDLQHDLFFSTVLTAQKTQAAEKTEDIESRRTQLLSLFDEEWQYELRTNPEMATSIGDNRYNDRLNDHSPEFYQSDVEARRKFLDRFEAVESRRTVRAGCAQPRVDDPQPAPGY